MMSSSEHDSPLLQGSRLYEEFPWGRCLEPALIFPAHTFKKVFKEQIYVHKNGLQKKRTVIVQTQIIVLTHNQHIWLLAPKVI